MKLVVHVTWSDINLGTRNTPNRCPVALATKRQLSNPGWLAVYGNCWFYGTSGGLLPPKVQSFIQAFDAGASRRNLKPFQFTLKSYGEK